MATQGFIARYAQDVAPCRAGHHRHEVTPKMTPLGDVGRRGVRAYAARGGQTEEAFLKELGEPLTPEIAGSALVSLIRADPATASPEYVGQRPRRAVAPGTRGCSGCSHR
jgi:hypothetical protein